MTSINFHLNIFVSFSLLETIQCDAFSVDRKKEWNRIKMSIYNWPNNENVRLERLKYNFKSINSFRTEEWNEKITSTTDTEKKTCIRT